MGVQMEMKEMAVNFINYFLHFFISYNFIWVA